jgi:hypothetical protein
MMCEVIYKEGSEEGKERLGTYGSSAIDCDEYAICSR